MTRALHDVGAVKGVCGHRERTRIPRKKISGTFLAKQGLVGGRGMAQESEQSPPPSKIGSSVPSHSTSLGKTPNPSVLPSFLGCTVIADSKPFSQQGCDREGIQRERPLPYHKCGSALVTEYREKPKGGKKNTVLVSHFPGFTLLITSPSNVAAAGKSQRFPAVCFSTLCHKYDFF